MVFFEKHIPPWICEGNILVKNGLWETESTTSQKFRESDGKEEEPE